MDTKVNIPYSISGVYVPVRAAQWSDTADRMFTPYLVQTDSVMYLDLLFRTMFVQSTFSLLVGTLSSSYGAMGIRLVFILLKHCEKSVLAQSALHYGIPNALEVNRPDLIKFLLEIGKKSPSAQSTGYSRNRCGGNGRIRIGNTSRDRSQCQKSAPCYLILGVR